MANATAEKTNSQDYLVVKVKDFWEGQALLKHFNQFRPVAWQTKDHEGDKVVMPCDDPLGYAKEAAGCLGKSVRVYGLRANGEHFHVVDK